MGLVGVDCYVVNNLPLTLSYSYQGAFLSLMHF